MTAICYILVEDAQHPVTLIISMPMTRSTSVVGIVLFDTVLTWTFAVGIIQKAKVGTQSISYRWRVSTTTIQMKRQTFSADCYGERKKWITKEPSVKEFFSRPIDWFKLPASPLIIDIAVRQVCHDVFV